MSMYGNPSAPVGLARDASTLVVTKRTAMTIPNPKAPLSRVVRSMDQGTVTSALATSSDIYGRSQEGKTCLTIEYPHELRHHILCSH